MKSILFLGDSLTAGQIGSSYMKLLQDNHQLKEYNLINAGENGFTMAGLYTKLENYLKKNSAPDALIVEGGANDILLPHMQNSDPSWIPFARKLARHGSTAAASAPEFKEQCGNILTAAFEGGVSHVFICTIPCLGEDLESELNILRGRYNQILREVCIEFSERDLSCTCIDAAVVIEQILGNDGSSWLFSTSQELQTDATIILEKGEDYLCDERGLKLTIDGAHLNKKGAELFSSLIIQYFKDNLLIL